MQSLINTSWSEGSKRIRCAALAAAACVGLLAVPSASTAKSVTGPPATLSVAISTSATDMLTYIAQSKGYFKSSDVNVTIDSGTGTSTSALVVSGRVNLAGYALIGAAAVANQGQPAQVIFSNYGGGAGGDLMVSANGPATSLRALANVQNCVIAAYSQGSATYGFAALYIHKLGLSNCQLEQMPSFTSQLAGLLDGSITAVVGNPTVVIAPTATSQVKILIDTANTTDFRRYVGPTPEPDVGFWGLQSVLAKKHVAVVRFLEGLEKARAFMLSHQPKQILPLLEHYPLFSAIPQPQLLGQIALFKQEIPLGNTDGLVSAAEWSSDLSLFSYFGISGFNTTVPQLHFGRIINMTYLTRAIAATSTSKKTKKG
jgi:ABC-type nitrate/sulfonate/bicarbonate transport system substrate-binding protein